MVAIVDYGVGNLFSLQSSFGAIGQEAEVTADPERILRADRVILPGVGAFADAAEKLRESGLDQTVRAVAEAGKPLMGSFCSNEAWNTESIRGWASCAGRSGRSRNGFLRG